MNSLDSRHLRVGDTFAQRFTTPGTYRYTVGVTGSLTDGGDGSFTIKVGEDAGAAPKTYYVGVLFANGAFGVDKETVEIARNDVVMWSTAAAAAPPSVPMKVRLLSPGSLHSKARKEHLHHAHGTEPDRGSSGWHRHVRRPQADGCAGASRCVTRTI